MRFRFSRIFREDEKVNGGEETNNNSKQQVPSFRPSIRPRPKSACLWGRPAGCNPTRPSLSTSQHSPLCFVASCCFCFYPRIDRWRSSRTNASFYFHKPKALTNSMIGGRVGVGGVWESRWGLIVISRVSVKEVSIHTKVYASWLAMCCLHTVCFSIISHEFFQSILSDFWWRSHQEETAGVLLKNS